MTAGAHAPTKLYVAIWAWLAGLMLLGVVLSELNILPLPSGMILVIVLALSLIKAILVATYYMHLKSDTRLFLFIALTPFVLVALAIGLLVSSRFVRL